MRGFAKVAPQIWINDTGRQIKKLGIEARVVSLYLETNPSACMTGVYYIPIVLISHDVGLSIDQTSKTLNELVDIGYCSYDFESEYVWVHDMARDQISSELKPKDHRVKGVKKIIDTLPALPFKQDFIERYNESLCLTNQDDLDPSKPLVSKEKENDKEKNNENESTLSGKPDGSCIKNSKNEYLKHSKEILEFLNEKFQKRFRTDGPNQKLVIARLKSGVTPDQCRAVIAMKYREWQGTDMKKWLRPATIFNATKFEQYLGECVAPELQDEDCVRKE